MENGEEEEERERVRYLLVFYSKPYAKNAVSHFLLFPFSPSLSPPFRS